MAQEDAEAVVVAVDFSLGAEQDAEQIQRDHSNEVSESDQHLITIMGVDICNIGKSSN